MKIVIVPMSAVAQTEGPFYRAKVLTTVFSERKMQVAMCLGDDRSSLPVNNVARYPLSIPVPMGLPKWIGLRTYPLADKFGIVGRLLIALKKCFISQAQATINI